MVKTFEEFVNEQFYDNNVHSPIDIPECLLKIVDHINSKTLIHNIHADGRVGSIKDEEDCIIID